MQKAKQKRTMADMRITGTAMFSWLSDQVGAAAAGAASTRSTWPRTAIARRGCYGDLLVPQLHRSSSRSSTAGSIPTTTTSTPTDPLSRHVMAIRSAAATSRRRDGRYLHGHDVRSDRLRPGHRLGRRLLGPLAAEVDLFAGCTARLPRSRQPCSRRAGSSPARPCSSPGRALASRDIPLFHLPLRAAFRRLAAGGPPVWNPWLHGGQPVLSNPNYAAFYPPSWLVFAVPPAYALSLLVLLHAAVAFAGAWLLARRLGAGRGRGGARGAGLHRRRRLAVAAQRLHALLQHGLVPLGARLGGRRPRGARRRPGCGRPSSAAARSALQLLNGEPVDGGGERPRPALALAARRPRRPPAAPACSALAVPLAARPRARRGAAPADPGRARRLAARRRARRARMRPLWSMPPGASGRARLPALLRRRRPAAARGALLRLEPARPRLSLRRLRSIRACC